MPETLFLPYRTSECALSLAVGAVRLDGDLIERGEVVDEEHAFISLDGRRSWRELSFDVQVVDENDELDELLHDGERVGAALEVGVVLRNKETRFRRMVTLQRDAEGRWNGEVGICLHDQRGSLEVIPFAVRCSRHAGGDGRASRPRERVAWGRPWHVYIDEKPVLPGGAIDGEWAEFQTSPLLSLRQHADCSSYLDLTDPERPRLFLNESIRGLRRALESTARVGRSARVRDALMHSILQPVLCSLATEAIAQEARAEVADPESWRWRLLLALAGHSSTAGAESCARSWIQSWRDEQEAVALSSVALVIQRHLKMSDGASKLIEALEVGENG